MTFAASTIEHINQRGFLGCVAGLRVPLEGLVSLLCEILELYDVPGMIQSKDFTTRARHDTNCTTDNNDTINNEMMPMAPMMLLMVVVNDTRYYSNDTTAVMALMTLSSAAGHAAACSYC